MEVQLTIKERALELIRDMPDESTIDDIGYELYALESIQAGLDELDRGDILSHEEVGDRLKKWLE